MFIITVRQRSCRKVMFSQVSLCPGGGGGQVGDRVSPVPGPLLGPCPFGSWDISGGNTLPALWDTLPVRDIGPEIPYPLEGTWDQRCSTLQKGHGTRDTRPHRRDMGQEISYPLRNHESGRYAFYWNAFLLHFEASEANVVYLRKSRL